MPRLVSAEEIESALERKFNNVGNGYADIRTRPVSSAGEGVQDSKRLRLGEVGENR